MKGNGVASFDENNNSIVINTEGNLKTAFNNIDILINDDEFVKGWNRVIEVNKSSTAFADKYGDGLELRIVDPKNPKNDILRIKNGVVLKDIVTELKNKK